jgi:cobalt/nickel transport system permease protein/cobalt/nickel transport protein
MSKTLAHTGLLLSLYLGLGLATTAVHAQWPGADDVVEGKAAAQAGRAARPPLDGIDTSHGDLALFAFMIAGLVGGFVVGYYFRELFPPRSAPPPAPSPCRGGGSEVPVPSPSRERGKGRRKTGGPPHV